MKKPQPHERRFSREFEVALDGIKHLRCVYSITEQELDQRIAATNSVIRPDTQSTKLH